MFAPSVLTTLCYGRTRKKRGEKGEGLHFNPTPLTLLQPGGGRKRKGKEEEKEESSLLANLSS